MMHTALGIHEILLRIAKALEDQRQVFALLLTCKAFLDPTLDILWAALPSFLPLLNLLPSHIVNGNGTQGNPFSLSRTAGSADLARFTPHARRVRRFSWHEKSVLAKFMGTIVLPSMFAELAKIVPSSHILPGLKTLEWAASSPQGLIAIRFFLAPGIMKIRLQQFKDQDGLTFSSVVQSFQQIRQLQSLHIAGCTSDDDVPSFNEALANLLHEHSPIRRIGSAMQQLTAAEFLNSLQRVPALLHIALESYGWLPAGPGQCLVFHRLQTLELSSTIPAATFILLNLTAVCLHTLSLSLSGMPSHRGAFAVPSQAWHNLSTFRLMRSSSDGHLVLRMSNIQPLISNCPHMKVFNIAAYVQDLDDESLSEMADAWPKLRALHFESRPLGLFLETHRPRSTLLGFQKLVAACTKLRTLSLCLDATTSLLASSGNGLEVEGSESESSEDEQEDNQDESPNNEQLSRSGAGCSDNPGSDEAWRSLEVHFGASLITDGLFVGRCISSLQVEHQILVVLIQEWEASFWNDETYEQRRSRRDEWRKVSRAKDKPCQGFTSVPHSQ